MRKGVVVLEHEGATASGQEGKGTREDGAVDVKNLALGGKRTRGRDG